MVGNKVTNSCIIFIIHAVVKRKRVSVSFEQELNLVGANTHLCSDFLNRRFTLKLLSQLANCFVHLCRSFDHMNRNSDSARLFLYSTTDSLTNPPSSISGELIALREVILGRSFHKTDITLLHQVHESHTSVADILASYRNYKAKVMINHFIDCLLVACKDTSAKLSFLTRTQKRNATNFTHIKFYTIAHRCLRVVPICDCIIFCVINNHVDASIFKGIVDCFKLVFLENLFNFSFVDNIVVLYCLTNQTIKSFFHRYPLLFPFIKYHFFSYIYIITYFL